jgi:hypothetical protein
MNLKDEFVQISVTPSARLQCRLDYHRLHLSESADRWYSGGGAMANTGTINGFAARKTGGKNDLGSAVELLASWNLEKNTKLNLFVSRFRGGDAVEHSYAREKNQTFSYIELVNEFH